MHIDQLFELKGKVGLVTGGAGLFGRQIAQALAEAGAQVWIASRNKAALKEQTDRWTKEGLNVKYAALDQGCEESICSLCDRILQESGGVDVLVNNAVARPMSTWHDTADLFSQSMQVNMTGLFLMTRTFAEVMASHGSGSIINVGSIQGSVGPDFSLYADTTMSPPPDYFVHKGGLIQLTRYTAALYGPAGVRVNTITPGGFFNHQPTEFVQRYCERTFLGRLANETDLKGIIVFLASQASAYITGSVIPVDGGYTAK